MPFFRNIRDAKTINWGKSYLYSVKIDDAPSPFDRFMPVREITIPSSSVEPYSFESFISTYHVPLKTQGKQTINLVLYDDIDLTMKRFFEEWIEEIFPENGEYVATLESAVKTIYVQRLNNQRDVVEQRAYTVFPVGVIRESLASDGGLHSFGIDLQIVGMLEV